MEKLAILPNRIYMVHVSMRSHVSFHADVLYSIYTKLKQF